MASSNKANDKSETATSGRLVMTKAAAEHVGYAETTFEKKRLDGSGPPFYKVGRRVLYDLIEVESWARSQRCTSTAELVA